MGLSVWAALVLTSCAGSQDLCAGMACGEGRVCVAGRCVADSEPGAGEEESEGDPDGLAADGASAADSGGADVEVLDLGPPERDAATADAAADAPAADATPAGPDASADGGAPDEGAPDAPQLGRVVRVTAYIDGLSQLKIQNNALWWHHVTWYPPGKLDIPKPTVVNGQWWFPTWPFTGDGKDCDCDSSAYDLLQAGVDLGPAPELVRAVKVSGPSPVTLIAAPSAENGHLTVVELHDLDWGASWYEIELAFE